VNVAYRNYVANVLPLTISCLFSRDYVWAKFRNFADIWNA